MQIWLRLSALGALCLGGLAACATSSVPASTEGGGGGDAGGAGGGLGGAGGSSSATTTSAATSSATSSSASASSSSSGAGGGPNLCGNGQIDPGEACDGADFGAKDCTTYGLGSGALLCNPFCGVVVSGCIPNETCADGIDNDGDLEIDCDDSDCLLAVTCADSCAVSKQVAVPFFDFGTTEGHPSVRKSSCSSTSGNEVIYEVVAPATDTLTISLESFNSLDFSISVRTACGDDASEIACSSHPPAGTIDEETLVIAATQGTTYFVMVDTTGPVTGSYDLTLDFPVPEAACGNFFDDDGDGLLDCDDATSCQGSIDCTSGTGATGTPCLVAADCAANHDDPVCLPPFKGFVDGYCSEFCDLAAPDCAGAGVCAQLGLSTNGVCLAGCVGDADCRTGYTCQDKGLANKVCLGSPETDCNDNVDNDGNGVMDCEDPGCQALPDCAPGAKAAGQPCSLNNECFSSSNDPLCISNANFGWPGGYCSQSCDVALNDCVGGALCFNELFFQSNNGQCLATCLTVADCRPGYSCIDVGQPKKVCVF